MTAKLRRARGDLLIFAASLRVFGPLRYIPPLTHCVTQEKLFSRKFNPLESTSYRPLFSLPVIVAALGYFVDIYDLLLFGIVRLPSMKTLGLSIEDGVHIINWQMGGLLLGGILWGILGDKRGRLSVLFGSIMLYSAANILCGFLPHFPRENSLFFYSMLRFIAGIGLAGELGAGITLVSESLPQRLRGIGTSLVAGFGLLGAVVANLTVKLSDEWTVAYFIGGGMGISLLLLRIGVAESGIYKETAGDPTVRKGNFFMFFNNRSRFTRYLRCIGIGLPTWYCIGVLAQRGEEFGTAMNIEGGVDPGNAIMWGYIGISAGDFFSGFLSHWLRSRKKAILWMMAFTVISVVWILYGGIRSNTMYYALCVWFGFGTGYWAMFVTVGAEQFGTNIRSTAATTIPNIVRGTVPLMYFAFEFFTPMAGIIGAGALVGLICFTIGIYSTATVPETHDRNLDFTE
jgi:MFS family permease